jgi:squalene-hopene/tetraprenyl-beta-curcumene cyclase
VPHAPPASADATVRRAVSRGLQYLRNTQETDGSWGDYPATTALAVSAFLRNGRNELNEPAVAKGIVYILRSVKPDGGIYSDANPARALPNYNTSLCLMALGLAHNAAYAATIRKAQAFVEGMQFDESHGVPPSDPRYGGIGYGTRQDRPDLSNLQETLEGLKDSGAPANAPFWKKAIVFLQRVQNRRESNDQAWSKTGDNDGGFLYNSQGKSYVPGGEPHSYGSMTYAGLKSYIYCGVTRSDPRAQAAWGWIRSHYSIKENPGMGASALYYYYNTMAKTLNVYGQKIVRDTSGATHDWSRELGAQLVSLQHPDGSWYNDNSRFWENQPGLVTAYTLIALSYCLKHS